MQSESYLDFTKFLVSDVTFRQCQTMGLSRMGSAGDYAGSGGARRNGTSSCVAGRERPPIDLAPVLDGPAANGLRDVLSKAIASNEPVRVNAGPVERISTGCVQLLLAGARSAAMTGNTFAVSDHSDAFTAAFDDLGLREILEDWTKPT
jgi:anti-anti-sigma regulatory factor